MALADRLKKYREIEQLRERPLFAYVTSARQNAGGWMASDALPEIMDQVLLLPRDADRVDLLIVSNGGDATVAWRIMSLLREKVKTIGVLVPQSAFSAATLLALGADEIIMHPCGNLGPVDPQIPAIPAQGPPARSSFSLEDLPGFLRFVRERLGLSEHEHLKSAFELFCKEAGAMQIAMGTRAAQLSLSLGEKLLRMHMRDAEGQKKATAIAETLNTKFFYHGYPVGRREAKEIALKVIDPGERLETLMWEVWLDFEEEMKCRTPFNPMEEVAKSPAASQVLASIPQLTIPSGLSPDQMRQIAQQLVRQISPVSLPPIDYELRSGMIESCRKASAFVTNGKILARRRGGSTSQPRCSSFNNRVRAAMSFNCPVPLRHCHPCANARDNRYRLQSGCPWSRARTWANSTGPIRRPCRIGSLSTAPDWPRNRPESSAKSEKVAKRKALPPAPAKAYPFTGSRKRPE